eukprot:GHVT01011837.1.p2 GENE.GHVT01011837.1~~GHVT01011837.1.p2  ORF type:complete len:100 (-),score=15.00 GHVT01011837.1:603-902(-)
MARPSAHAGVSSGLFPSHSEKLAPRAPARGLACPTRRSNNWSDKRKGAEKEDPSREVCRRTKATEAHADWHAKCLQNLQRLVDQDADSTIPCLNQELSF